MHVLQRVCDKPAQLRLDTMRVAQPTAGLSRCRRLIVYSGMAVHKRRNALLRLFSNFFTSPLPWNATVAPDDFRVLTHYCVMLFVMYTRTSDATFMCTYVHILAYAHERTSHILDVRTRVCIHARRTQCLCTRIFPDTHACTHATRSVYVHTHMHAHTRTHEHTTLIPHVRTHTDRGVDARTRV